MPVRPSRNTPEVTASAMGGGFLAARDLRSLGRIITSGMARHEGGRMGSDRERRRPDGVAQANGGMPPEGCHYSAVRS